MTTLSEQTQPTRRLATGIRGLDTVLKGGLFRGGLYLLAGLPGTGKTILSNQACFNHVAAGGRAVYVTLLVEPHGLMVSHLQSMSFYDPSVVGDSMVYVSGYTELEKEGLTGLLDLLRQTIRDRKATLMVLDSLETVRHLSDSEVEFNRFVHLLQVHTHALGCTSLLLAPFDETRTRAEYALVDGLVELNYDLIGQRAVRQMQVWKFRGSDMLPGRHVFSITDAGITVYPRTEVLVASEPSLAASHHDRLAFGVPGLDQIMQGGVVEGTTTVILGAPGTGKSSLGLHFLTAGARAGEPSLYFGFYEPPPDLIDKANALGLAIDPYLANDTLQLIWYPPLEVNLDVLSHRLLAEVRRRGVRRLFVDGLSGFQMSAEHPERLSRYLVALCTQLRTLGVTFALAAELPELFDVTVRPPVEGLAVAVDNIIFLRYVERQSQLVRLLSILTARQSAYDTSIREFRITSNGIEVAANLVGGEAHPGGPSPVRPPAMTNPPSTSDTE
ncbi:MAG: recombinase RecA [Anaerolineae bacterium]|nr:recombinase RecA [Anaerolineae bacterium]